MVLELWLYFACWTRATNQEGRRGVARFASGVIFWLRQLSSSFVVFFSCLSFVLLGSLNLVGRHIHVYVPSGLNP